MSRDDAARLGHMAGQIAAFFHHLPEDEAATAIAGHINQFWSPRMRRALLAEVETAPLDPLVRRALPLVRLPAEEARQGLCP